MTPTTEAPILLQRNYYSHGLPDWAVIVIVGFTLLAVAIIALGAVWAVQRATR